MKPELSLFHSADNPWRLSRRGVKMVFGTILRRAASLLLGNSSVSLSSSDFCTPAIPEICNSQQSSLTFKVINKSKMTSATLPCSGSFAECRHDSPTATGNPPYSVNGLAAQTANSVQATQHWAIWALTDCDFIHKATIACSMNS